ncbi:SMC faily protein [Streptococcus pneumoniae]|uniref:AAA family ATPase n=3 Tax=Streptococcus pneumoniae TaxID=1313 RepID=UPI001023FF9C|nr:AAA family ATPase [Streptococcus pneumoniae]VFH47933.1 SMC faily protein [Streptococcus pneumoniae]VIR11026.1 SMC faily protein [Streptococcus pneumoniae]VIR25228.1 SMC faily protein [Streptococcus pneumoniae]VMT80772.1 SMC faily protein [Streptococcus pneumoniae]VOF44639.1 SMC faily protein [Streptococcus pneumoniae]
MRGFNNKIKSVYQELTNSKEKFGSFHKTLIHLHTPVSYDYKLFSNWTATKYRKITEDELYDIFFENKKIKVDKTIFFSNFDKVVFSSSKEYISFLMLAEAIIKNGIEIVVVTDHNTTKGITKLQMAVSIIMKNYPIYDIHPHILHGVEISAADKLHIVCIYDYEQESWVNQWLSENIISEKDGSYQHSLTIMKDFNNQKIVNYIAHFNSYDILKKGSHLLGAYKRKIFSKENTRFLEFNINSKESSQQLDILYKEVGVLSLGQKVVAMLDFLLAYSDYSKDFRLLIIDQPEDNLDNRYIYRHLVQQFRDVKAQRQIILATHNATIVTNSMTDQVVIMESDGVNGWIESQGYVSEKYIKNHIINQLERGKDSFKHKMSIYETALSE